MSNTLSISLRSLPTEVYQLAETLVPRLRTFVDPYRRRGADLRYALAAALADLLDDPDLTAGEATLLAGIILPCSPNIAEDLLATHVIPNPDPVPAWLSLAAIDPSSLFACIPLGHLDDLFAAAINQLAPTHPMPLYTLRLIYNHVPSLELIAGARNPDHALVAGAFTAEALNHLIDTAYHPVAVFALLTELTDSEFERLIARLDPSQAELAGLLAPHVTSPERLATVIARLPPAFEFPYVYAWLRQVLVTDEIARLLKPHLSTALTCEYIFQTMISNLPCARPYPSATTITELSTYRDLVPADYLSLNLDHLPTWYLVRLLRALPSLVRSVINHDRPGDRLRYRIALKRFFAVTGADRPAVLRLLTNPAVTLDQALDAASRLSVL